MKVGSGGNLDLSTKYHKKLFGPIFYSWWNGPLHISVNDCCSSMCMVTKRLLYAAVFSVNPRNVFVRPTTIS